uniref:Uncharacterized protein n=1 Tax=Arundo donax TaxID=35708 RepID=A0A0A9AE95_ARUDO
MNSALQSRRRCRLPAICTERFSSCGYKVSFL